MLAMSNVSAVDVGHRISNGYCGQAAAHERTASNFGDRLWEDDSGEVCASVECIVADLRHREW